jgi:hypothetical protein
MEPTTINKFGSPASSPRQRWSRDYAPRLALAAASEHVYRYLHEKRGVATDRKLSVLMSLLWEAIGCRTAAQARISERQRAYTQLAKRLAVKAVTMTQHSNATLLPCPTEDGETSKQSEKRSNQGSR